MIGSRSRRGVALAAASLLLVLGGCTIGGGGQSSGQSSGQTNLLGQKPDPSEKYVMVTFLSGIEFWKPAYRGMQDAGNLLGVSTQYTGTEQYDAQAEATVLSQVAASKPAGIVATAQNPDALKGVFDQIIGSGTTLVGFDSDSPNSKRPSIVQVGNLSGGQRAADYMAQLAGGKGDVAIITTPGQFNLDQRAAGFKAQIAAKYPGMKVIGEASGLADNATAAKVAGSFIQADPNLVGIFSTGSAGAPGAVQALKLVNKLGKVHLVGFDIDAATIDGITKGEIDGTIVQGAYCMGFWATMEAYVLHHNLSKPVANPAAAGVDPLPTSVDCGTYLATKSNINSFQ